MFVDGRRMPGATDATHVNGTMWLGVGVVSEERDMIRGEFAYMAIRAENVRKSR